VFGDLAVLTRLEHLGKHPRRFENLVQVGFPEHQLLEARDWYYRDATTAVERYAAEKMAQGYFEDESLLELFCRYYECTDWKLEQSPWFFSREDYRRFNKVLVDPVKFHVAMLEEEKAEERWGANFLKLPFDLGMEQAKRSLWQEILRRDYYWKPQSSYVHLRAANMFDYLARTLDIVDFSLNQFNYRWEQAFRKKLEPGLREFVRVLERCVRMWQDRRQERTHRRFHYRSYRSLRQHPGEANLQQALAYLGLEPDSVSLRSLRRRFRHLSKKTHPDQGGSPEEFRRLAACKELVEDWLKRTRLGGSHA
jgi:hypothetical protein